MTEEPGGADLLRKLALHDEAAVASLMTPEDLDDATSSRIAPKLRGLLVISALIASDSEPTSLQWAVSQARAAGAADDEIVGALRAVGPVVGSARITRAAIPLAAALGYEVDVFDD